MGQKGDRTPGRWARVLTAVRRRRPPGWLSDQLAGTALDAPVLSWAPLGRADQAAADEPMQALIATRHGLLRATRTGEDPLIVLWHDVDKATWQTPALGLELADGGGLTFRLDDPGNLPRDVRTRVEQSIAWSSHHRLADRGGVRVVARRPSSGGDLQWRLVADAGTDLSDPGLLAEAEQHLTAARSAAG